MRIKMARCVGPESTVPLLFYHLNPLTTSLSTLHTILYPSFLLNTGIRRSRALAKYKSRTSEKITLTHAKSNHSVSQSSPSRPIISPKAELVQLLVDHCSAFAGEESLAAVDEGGWEALCKHARDGGCSRCAVAGGR